MPPGLPFAADSEVRQAFSSAPYNPAAAAARRNRLRVAGPVRPPPPTKTPATSSAAAECCETDPTGVATVRLAREWVVWLCPSSSAAPRRLNELNRAAYLASRTLAANSRCGVVIQGKMVDLVSEVSGFLAYAQTEIPLRRRTRAGIQNFGLIVVKLGVSEVELGSVCNGGIASGVALGDKLKTPHSNDRRAFPSRCAAQIASQTHRRSQL